MLIVTVLHCGWPILPQNISDSSDALREQEIWNYVVNFTRTSLVPVYPLHRLATTAPVGHSSRTTIHRYHSQVTVPVGTTRYLKLPTRYLELPPQCLELRTITLCFNPPQRVLNCPALGFIHIPLAMWSDKEPTRTSLVPEDDRAPDLQIGDSEVKSAIYYHLVARSRALQKGVNTSALNPLFGQVLLRQFVSARLLLIKW